MDNLELMSFINALEKYVRARFKYRTQSTIKGLGPTIVVSRYFVELYLRSKPKHYYDLDRPLVIAVMRFRQRQKGHGTALLNFGIDCADEFNLGTVVLESTNLASTTFAKRRGFIRYPGMQNAWQVSIADFSMTLVEKGFRQPTKI